VSFLTRTNGKGPKSVKNKHVPSKKTWKRDPCKKEQPRREKRRYRLNSDKVKLKSQRRESQPNGKKEKPKRGKISPSTCHSVGMQRGGTKKGVKKRGKPRTNVRNVTQGKSIVGEER